MLNNGHSGMGNGPGGPPPGGMYGGGPSEYSPNNSYMSGPHPSSGNGLHSMTLNQNTCPPNNKDQKWCEGCRGPIMERYLLHALDGYWHNHCLKCSQCCNVLAELGQSCFTRDGMILCRNDYLKLFGNGGACASCRQGIPASELVMRAGVSPPGSSPPLVYHVRCFACDACKRQLVQGDRYSVINGVLFCGDDAMKLMKNGISPSTNVATTNGPARKGKVGRPRRSRD